MKRSMWILWGLVTVSLAGFYAYKLFVDTDKSAFLVGDTTHGHYQIEMACDACHTEAFSDEDVLQNACVQCHEADLEAGHDSHPKKKFTDPRNADRLAVIDARYCVSCHKEHQKEQTNAMGVTLPDDYCYHCHQEIATERESHKDLAFDSCASAGCHNYHDNRALYENFLVKNAGGDWIKPHYQIDTRNAAKLTAKTAHPALNRSYAEQEQQYPEITEQWLADRHGQAGLSCGVCHDDEKGNWLEKPDHRQCAECHEDEYKGFSEGKHGMRAAVSLPAMSVAEALLPFNKQAGNAQHGCNGCHAAHNFDTQFAGKRACLNCHADEHSLAFEKSPHAKITGSTEYKGDPADNMMSCATCHLPAIKKKQNGTEVVYIEHNQNVNLRPNEKMIRPVCMQCHSLEFSIDALADEELIKNNFSSKPTTHIPSVDWAMQRADKK